MAPDHAMAPVLFFPSFPILCFSHIGRVYYVYFDLGLSSRLNLIFRMFIFVFVRFGFFTISFNRLLRPRSCNLSFPFVPVLAVQVSVQVNLIAHQGRTQQVNETHSHASASHFSR